MFEILSEGALVAAPALLGSTLVHDLPEGTIAGIITETEAYTADDPAAHTFRGKTPRNEALFMEAGHAYVYFTYGLHYCFNVVTGKVGQGDGVLIRAVIPTAGLELIAARRPGISEANWCNGPAKLTQAFGITPTYNKHNLSKPPLRLILGKPLPYITTPRIGITQGKEKLWRFVATEIETAHSSSLRE